MDIARYFDSAVLKPDYTRQQVIDEIKASIAVNSRTVCVRGCDIDLAMELTKGTDTGVSCVLDFPYGYGGAEAKGAIAAGIRTLLETACVTEAEIDTLYIAGGFGSHLDAESAAAIGLIPPRLKDRVCVLGNAALSGAARMLLNREEISRTKALTDCAETVALGGNSRFNRHFVEAMLFDNEQFFE